LAVIFTVVMFLGFLDNDGVVLEQNNVPQYIPSNITKANPNILAGSGSSSWRTTNISDVSDDVLFTIQGTVLEIGDPINFISTHSSIVGHGLIPISITVDKVHKGQLDTQDFTFYLTSLFPLQNDGSIEYVSMSTDDRIVSILYDANKKYILLPQSGEFEIGEKVVVHISKFPSREPYMVDDVKNLEQIKSHYSLTLGEYSKYQIQNNLAYNEKFSTGISLDRVMNESK